MTIDCPLAPGAQGRLFITPVTNARLRLSVVTPDGTRTPPVAHVAVAAAQAHAAARATGRAWVEGTDGQTVEIAVRDGAVAVAPRGPGWPDAMQRLMAEQATTTQETT